jgi:hypothetical protein
VFDQYPNQPDEAVEPRLARRSLNGAPSATRWTHRRIIVRRGRIGVSRIQVQATSGVFLWVVIASGRARGERPSFVNR